MRGASSLVALAVALGALGSGATGAVLKPVAIAVGSSPMSLVAGGGSIWVANHDDGTVSRIDPRTNRVAATIRVGGQPWGLAYGAGSLWVGNDEESSVARVDVSCWSRTKRRCARRPAESSSGKGIECTKQRTRLTR